MMKNWTKITISVLLVIASLILIYSLKTFSTRISGTGQFILVGGSTVGLIAGLGLLFSMLLKEIQVTKWRGIGKDEEMERQKEDGLKTLGRILYVIESNKTLGRKKRIEKTINGIAPYIRDMIKEHPSFLYTLDERLKETIGNVYTSIYGRHRHFNPFRAEGYVNKLEHELSKLLSKYEGI